MNVTGNKNILITGGAGFVGASLAISLKKKYKGYQIFCLDNLKRRGSELNINRLKEYEINFIHGDIRNQEDLYHFDHLDVLIDASADPSVLSGINSPILPLVNSNLFGTINCLELAKKLDAAFIFLSTSRIYPIKTLESCLYEEQETRYTWKDQQIINGVSSEGVTENFPLEGSRSFYGSSKLASEMFITEYNELKDLKTIINRCGVISGPWQMGKVDQGVIVLWLARHYFKGELSYIGYGGSGKQMRDVLHIDDLFHLIDDQLNNLEIYNGQTINVGGGIKTSFSLQELTLLCQEVTGNKININSIKEDRIADVRIYVSDCSKLYSMTDWEPKKKVKELVEDTFQWLKENEKDLQQVLN